MNNDPRHLPALLGCGLLLIVPALLFAQESGHGDMIDDGWIGLLGLGFLFGLKHALDADHLVAITTIVGENRSTRSAAAMGLWWGIGHTLSLLVAGMAVLLLRLEIPGSVETALEMVVAGMIIVLGGRGVIRILGGTTTLRLGRHSHGSIEHIHPHLRATDAGDSDRSDHTRKGRRSGLRSLVVGIIHGLAGSAALMLLLLARISDPALGILYIIVFGLGSIIGMMAMSTLFWLPYLATAARFRRLDTGLRLATGIGSIAFGVMMFVELAS